MSESVSPVLDEGELQEWLDTTEPSRKPEVYLEAFDDIQALYRIPRRIGLEHYKRYQPFEWEYEESTGRTVFVDNDHGTRTYVDGPGKFPVTEEKVEDSSDDETSNGQTAFDALLKSLTNLHTPSVSTESWMDDAWAEALAKFKSSAPEMIQNMARMRMEWERSLIPHEVEPNGSITVHFPERPDVLLIPFDMTSPGCPPRRTGYGEPPPREELYALPFPDLDEPETRAYMDDVDS